MAGSSRGGEEFELQQHTNNQNFMTQTSASLSESFTKQIAIRGTVTPLGGVQQSSADQRRRQLKNNLREKLIQINFINELVRYSNQESQARAAAAAAESSSSSSGMSSSLGNGNANANGTGNGTNGTVYSTEERPPSYSSAFWNESDDVDERSTREESASTYATVVTTEQPVSQSPRSSFDLSTRSSLHSTRLSFLLDSDTRQLIEMTNHHNHHQESNGGGGDRRRPGRGFGAGGKRQKTGQQGEGAWPDGSFAEIQNAVHKVHQRDQHRIFCFCFSCLSSIAALAFFCTSTL